MSVIRHVSQLNNRLSNECGQACSTMLVNAYRGLSLTVEQLAAATGTNKGRFTPFYAYNILNDDDTVKERVPGLFDMLEHYSIRAAWTNNATWDWYQGKWAEDYPVIALVDYSQLSNIYWAAHFMVAVGEQGDFVVVYDPLQLTGPTLIPTTQFKRAINQPSAYVAGYDSEGEIIKGYNAVNQAMFPLKPLVPSALFSDRVQAVASDIRLAVR
jgi:hypothetical protein